ncbi:MAG: DinB family protein [Phycisphaerales bacterium]
MPELDRTLEILERTPSVLRQLLTGVSDFWVRGRYGEGTWSAFEVVGHLLVAEREDWMPRLKRILEHGERVPFDPFAHDATAAADLPLETLLSEFAALRAKHLRELRALGLSPADLDRTGMHPALGRVTAGQLLATWAVHDLHHTRQICLAMAWQYRDEVGPWRAYLNTLTR